jgi:energy-coupling factor transporter ATP-binding protein EcfA2
MKARALVQLNGNHRWHACSDDMRTERSGFAVAGALRSYRALPWVETRAGISLAPSQTATLRQALRAKVLVITGGPGVGKTTLVNSIIRLLGAKGTRILLAAPTNRAAKRMNEATGLEARTLHRLLEVDPRTGGFKRSEENPLEGDLLVVDEVSMVDVPLMYTLLKAVPLGMALLPRRGETSDFHWLDANTPEQVVRAVVHLVARHLPRSQGYDPIRDIQVLCPVDTGDLPEQVPLRRVGPGLLLDALVEGAQIRLDPPEVEGQQVAVMLAEPGERRDIGGASGQSHFGARSGIGFQELTVAGTPNLSTLPPLTTGDQANGLVLEFQRVARPC